jgi:LPXTG-site transpeptidase (sortase) family protein
VIGPPNPRPTTPPPNDAARDRVIELRQSQGLSIDEIAVVLDREGTALNRTGISEILAEQGELEDHQAGARLVRHAVEDEEPVEQSAEPASVSTADSVSGKYSISIPSIGVNAPVVSIASDDRVLVPPRDPGVVGWWRQGAAPGDRTGSAILVGHSVSAGVGVFDDVNQLDVGDTINVDELTYQVDSVQTLTKDELPSRAEELFDQSVSGRIVVVTCADWDGQTWQSNTIVIASPA